MGEAMSTFSSYCCGTRVRVTAGVIPAQRVELAVTARKSAMH